MPGDHIQIHLAQLLLTSVLMHIHPTNMSEPEPFNSAYLQVDDIHSIYYEQYGNLDGKPGNCSLSIL